ncbi:MAG: GtrA family protein [Erysipelotrichaceae bacterium]|nr:GtrA family protein [Bacillota bacterium]MDY3091300.1 GtrA family protein [Erysipelotrichaceae bacterium]
MTEIKNLLIKYKEQILYLFFGGCTTVVNIVVFALCSDILHMELLVSNFMAWVLAVFFAYITNKIWVFESKTETLNELVKEIGSFVFARVVTLLIDMLIMYVGVEILFINKMIIKVLANIVVIVANYVFSKLFIFKKK